MIVRSLAAVTAKWSPLRAIGGMLSGSVTIPRGWSSSCTQSFHLSSVESCEEVEVKVEHRETGVLLSGTGTTIAMALAMINHQISERF